MFAVAIISLIQYVYRRSLPDHRTEFIQGLFLLSILFLLYLLYAKFNHYFTGPRTHWDFLSDEEELLRYEAFHDNIIHFDYEDLERT